MAKSSSEELSLREQMKVITSHPDTLTLKKLLKDPEIVAFFRFVKRYDLREKALKKLDEVV